MAWIGVTDALKYAVNSAQELKRSVEAELDASVGVHQDSDKPSTTSRHSSTEAITTSSPTALPQSSQDTTDSHARTPAATADAADAGDAGDAPASPAAASPPSTPPRTPSPVSTRASSAARTPPHTADAARGGEVLDLATAKQRLRKAATAIQKLKAAHQELQSVARNQRAELAAAKAAAAQAQPAACTPDTCQRAAALVDTQQRLEQEQERAAALLSEGQAFAQREGELNVALKACRAKLHMEHEAHEAAKAELSAASARILALETEIKTIQSSASQQRSHEHKQVQLAEASETKASEARAAAARAQAEAQRALAKVDQLQRELAESKAHVAGLSDELNMSTSEKEGLERQLASSTEQIQQLQAALDVSQAALFDTRRAGAAKYSQWSDDVARLQAQLRQARQQLRDAEAQVASAEHEHMTIELPSSPTGRASSAQPSPHSMDADDDDEEAASQQFVDRVQMIAQLRMLLEQSQAENRELQAALVTAQAAAREARQAEQVDAGQPSLAAQLSAAQDEANRAATERASLLTRIESLTSALVSAQDAQATAEQALHSLQASMAPVSPLKAAPAASVEPAAGVDSDDDGNVVEVLLQLLGEREEQVQDLAAQLAELQQSRSSSAGHNVEALSPAQT